MLPLDVANANTNGGFPMGTLWLIVYITMAVMAVVIIPFAMFYYEGEEYDETGYLYYLFYVSLSLCYVFFFKKKILQKKRRER